MTDVEVTLIAEVTRRPLATGDRTTVRSTASGPTRLDAELLATQLAMATLDPELAMVTATWVVEVRTWRDIAQEEQF